MCRRYQRTTPIADLARVFSAVVSPEAADLPPLDIVVPTAAVPMIVRYAEAPRHRVLTAAHWGLVPFWARDAAMGARMFQARAEEAVDNPACRGPMKYRRCLIPADGFCIRQTRPTAGQPRHVRRRDGQPFALAGLWDLWRDEFQSCAVLTTAANDLLAPACDRMPVILAPRDHDRWLDPSLNDPAAVAPLLQPFPPDEFVATPLACGT